MNTTIAVSMRPFSYWFQIKVMGYEALNFALDSKVGGYSRQERF